MPEPPRKPPPLGPPRPERRSLPELPSLHAPPQEKTPTSAPNTAPSPPVARRPATHSSVPPSDMFEIKTEVGRLRVKKQFARSSLARILKLVLPWIAMGGVSAGAGTVAGTKIGPARLVALEERATKAEEKAESLQKQVWDANAAIAAKSAVITDRFDRHLDWHRVEVAKERAALLYVCRAFRTTSDFKFQFRGEQSACEPLELLPMPGPNSPAPKLQPIEIAPELPLPP